MRDRPGRPRARSRDLRGVTGGSGAGRAAPGRSTSRPATPDRPAGSRPAVRRAGAAGPGETTRTSAPAPPGRFTGRAVVLAVVLVALALSYVYPMRIYLTQQTELAQLRTGQRAQQDRIAELEALAAKWATEDYIRIQARQRLLMVRPGESLLIVEAPPPAGPAAGPAGAQPARAWYETLWTGVQAANGVDQ